MFPTMHPCVTITITRLVPSLIKMAIAHTVLVNQALVLVLLLIVLISMLVLEVPTLVSVSAYVTLVLVDPKLVTLVSPTIILVPSLSFLSLGKIVLLLEDAPPFPNTFEVKNTSHPILLT